MNTTQNRQIRLAARPKGQPEKSDWDLTSAKIAEPENDEVLVKIEYISLDPAMKGWMMAKRNYVEPVKIGEVMRAHAAGHVLASRHHAFSPGDAVSGILGVQTHAVVKGTELQHLDTTLAPLTAWLGPLGSTGLSAYFGMLDVGELQPGNIVVVSAASGAVGSMAGQIARTKGAYTVGITGGAEKCRYITNYLGFDASIDYTSDHVEEQLRQACTNGIDVFFDNVGGTILDAGLANLSLGARVVICGAISQYNQREIFYGPANYMSLVYKRAQMRGFIVFDFIDRYAQARHHIASWLSNGDLHYDIDIVHGIEQFPEALLKLFTGDKLGKLLLKP